MTRIQTDFYIISLQYLPFQILISQKQKFHQTVFALDIFFVFFFFGCAACGILAPRPRDRKRALAVKVPSSNHWTTREFLRMSFILLKRLWQIDQGMGKSNLSCYRRDFLLQHTSEFPNPITIDNKAYTLGIHKLLLYIYIYIHTHIYIIYVFTFGRGGFSLVAMSKDYFLVVVLELLVAVASLAVERGL